MNMRQMLLSGKICFCLFFLSPLSASSDISAYCPIVIWLFFEGSASGIARTFCPSPAAAYINPSRTSFSFLAGGRGLVAQTYVNWSLRVNRLDAQTRSQEPICRTWRLCDGDDSAIAAFTRNRDRRSWKDTLNLRHLPHAVHLLKLRF